MGHYRKGIRLAEGALKIHELLGDTAEQVQCLMTLAIELRPLSAGPNGHLEFIAVWRGGFSSKIGLHI